MKLSKLLFFTALGISGLSAGCNDENEEIEAAIRNHAKLEEQIQSKESKPEYATYVKEKSSEHSFSLNITQILKEDSIRVMPLDINEVEKEIIVYSNLVFWRYPECSKKGEDRWYSGEHITQMEVIYTYAFGKHVDITEYLANFHDYDCDGDPDYLQVPGMDIYMKRKELESQKPHNKEAMHLFQSFNKLFLETRQQLQDHFNIDQRVKLWKDKPKFLDKTEKKQGQ